MNHKIWFEVDSATLLRNLNFFKKAVGQKVKIMAVVKANAYGHGLLEVAGILKKDRNLFFGVDSIDEALFLKNSGIKNEIMILGYIPQNRFVEAVENNFHLSVYSNETLKMALKFPEGLFHLKVETGTNRLGISLESLRSFSFPSKFIGVYTHFADVEDTKSDFYKKQIAIFDEALDVLKSKNIFPKFIHVSSTAGILRSKETHFNMVRLGIGLYKNVLTWKTKVAQIKNVKIGETIGYDRTFRAIKNIKIAVLPVGYYDGYDRRLSSNGKVFINGKIAKVVGRVCMNMTMVDVTKIKNTKVNDNATLLGGKIKAKNMAAKVGTIDYEVLSRLNPNLSRIIV